MLQGKNAEHTFQITNTSTSPLSVIEIKKSCNCHKTSVVNTQEVAVGDDLEILLSVPCSRPGPLAKSILVQTDSTNESFNKIKLTLQATVEGVLWAEPSSLNFGELPSSGARKTRLVIHSQASGLPSRYLGFSAMFENTSIELIDESDNTLVFDVSLNGQGEKHLVVDLLTFCFQPTSDGVSKIRVSVSGRRKVQSKS